MKARNEYLLTLEATNASVFKYYIHDLPDIIDVSKLQSVFVAQTLYSSLKKVVGFVSQNRNLYV